MGTRPVRMVAMVVAVAALVTGTAVAADAYLAESEDVIYGCVKTNGQLRLVPEEVACAEGERRISWNRRGVPGEAGAPGSARAYGEITPSGIAYWRRNFNIASVEHPETGVYCIHVDPSIDTETVVPLVTVHGGTAERKYGTAAVGCGLPNHDGIQVNTFDGRTDEPIDTTFYLAIP